MNSRTHSLAHAPLDKRLRTLKASLRKLYLAGPDRPIARRNARRRVLSALRLMRATVDECFPAIVERTEPRARKTGDKRVKELEKAGWVEEQASVATRFAAAGVPVKHVKWKTTATVLGERKYVPGKGWVQDQHERVDHHDVFLVPEWAAAIGHDKPTALRAAKKSITLRKAALSAEGLR